MKRILALVLGDVNDIHHSKMLVLMDAEQDEIDNYTTRLESSDDIRNSKKYGKKINKFLSDNESFIVQMRLRHQKGDIVLLESLGNDDYMYRKLKVLYKKHVVALDKMLEDRKTMQRFLKLENIGVTEKGYRVLASGYLKSLIKKSPYERQIKFIKPAIKDSSYYDKLRLIVKAYKQERDNGRGVILPTIEKINDDYNINKGIIAKRKSKTIKKKIERTEINDKEEEYFYITQEIIDENGEKIYIDTRVCDGEEATFDDGIVNYGHTKRIKPIL